MVFAVEHANMYSSARSEFLIVALLKMQVSGVCFCIVFYFNSTNPKAYKTTG
jgi:hypothetical protein